MLGNLAKNCEAILAHGWRSVVQLEKNIATWMSTSQRIGTLLGTGCVLSIASWMQPSPRIAEQFLRIGRRSFTAGKCIATLVDFSGNCRYNKKEAQPRIRLVFILNCNVLTDTAA